MNAQDNQWIPVKERLPEIDEPVMIARYGIDLLSNKKTSIVSQGEYQGDNAWIDYEVAAKSHRTGWCYDVTHWQPLPKPPAKL